MMTSLLRLAGLYLVVQTIISCTSYNVTAKKEGVGPAITCKTATLMDEGGVCHDFRGCSDGHDHLKADDGCSWVIQ